MEHKEIEELVRKFLRGTISEAEKTKLFEWYALPAEEIEPEIFRSEVNKKALESQIFNRIQERIRVNSHPADLSNGNKTEAKTISFSGANQITGNWLKIAASIVLVISLGLLGRHWLASDPTNQLASAYQIIEVQAGKKKIIELSDGTKLHLNGKSKLRYPKNFTQSSTREVFLTGEAYFEVAKNAQKPFIITTNEAIIRVVGTAFNVKEIPFDSSVVVAVTEGTVAVKQAAKEAEEGIRITAGQMATIYHNHDIDTATTDVRNYMSWVNGWLVYKQTPLPEVVRQLEQVYGVKIRLQDPHLAKQRLTATIQYKSLTDVLDLIAATWDTNYERKRDEILLGTSF